MFGAEYLRLRRSFAKVPLGDSATLPLPSAPVNYSGLRAQKRTPSSTLFVYIASEVTKHFEPESCYTVSLELYVHDDN